MKPQTARVLSQLRERPVGAMDFQPPAVCDGGKPITRVAPRIRELRELGFVIRSERRRDGTALYTLEHDVEIPQPSGERPTGTARRRADPCKGVQAPAAADSSASRQAHHDGSLFDADTYADRRGYEDAA